MRIFVASLAAAVGLLLGGSVADAPPARAVPAATAPSSTVAVPASDTCPGRTATPVLARFGDRNPYFEVPDGSFARFGIGWTGDFRISPDNEPWRVGRSDTNSLALSAGGHAASEPLCLTTDAQTLRFFYRGTGYPGSELTVRVTIAGSAGTVERAYSLDTTDPAWHLSPVLALPDHSGEGTQRATIALVNTSVTRSPVPILVDDLLVDPWRSRGW